MNFLFNAGYALLYLSGGIIALLSIKASGWKSSVGQELLSISLGMIGFAIGLFIWCYYNLILKVDIPYPSYADVFFILYIPFLVYGIMHYLRGVGILITKSILFESCGIFIISIFITYFITPHQEPSYSVILSQMFDFFYLLGDAFLITLGIMLIRLTKGKIHKSFFYFIGALLVMAFADFLFAQRAADNTYWNGDISDLLFALSGLLFCLGISRIIVTQKLTASVSKKV